MNEKDNMPDRTVETPDGARTASGTRASVYENLSAQETRKLTPEKQAELLSALKARFVKQPGHYKRPEGVNFVEVRKALEANPTLMYSLAQMENTAGAPDIIAVEEDAFVFGDCSAESPNRRDLTYDQAVEMAREFGVDMMAGTTYREMQKTGKFDLTTWSWLKTPADARDNGHALLGYRSVVVVCVYRRDAGVRSPGFGWRGVLRVPRI